MFGYNFCQNLCSYIKTLPFMKKLLVFVWHNWNLGFDEKRLFWKNCECLFAYVVKPMFELKPKLEGVQNIEGSNELAP